MKKILPLLCLPLFVFAVYFDAGQPISPQSHHAPYAFTNVHVISMESEGVWENYTVITEEDRIVKLGPADEVKIPGDAHVIDSEGKYLMPGLAEMHGHVPPTDPGPTAPSYFNDKYVEHTLFLYVSAGITTVRGMLGYPNQLKLKDKVNNGELIGPNLYLAGPSFNGNTVSSPAQARERVKQQKEERWDLLKVHPGLTRPEYDAMAETANEIGIHFGGHVPQEVGIVHAIEMGQLTMDHIDGYVAYLNAFEEQERDQRMADIIQMTKEAGVWIVPTQALWETIIGAADYEAMKQYDELKYIPDAVKQNYFNFAENPGSSYSTGNPEAQAELRRKLLEEMNEADVKILMGTDAPQLFSVPGFSIHRELPLMQEANMTNYEIIETGTKNVGEYFAEWDDFGVVAEGQRADLILLNENPLQDLSAIKNHSGVMVQGKWYSREMIDKKLVEIEEYYAN
ncbi:MAG: amidohydrolase family protein [Gracilimonas sp.]|uniref:amidohydrolase family protein n=1 Tax=Gracilimonas TaxID=649462 RepID=UPI001B1DB183|nr:amidohydrolase family protein [Gracilimonas sp.]MBO6584702.1 amidohydrolase family protein [Gracilimonas sp.]MBO6616027.1 amidohydrolase family protein [Gracilimonas sp.]